MKKKNLSILSVAILLFLMYGVMNWHAYREKNMIDVLDTTHIEKIYVKHLPIKDGMAYNRQITDKASLQDLIDFLSQYKVKKVGDRDFVSEYPDEQFQFLPYYEDERITLPSLIERDVLLHDHYQYEITNGPIDDEWLEDFIKDKGEEV